MKSDDKLNQLEMIEQNVQQYLLQRQQFQAQLIEIESALKELEQAPEAYKIVGNIMVKGDKTKLAEELSRKKEMFEIRVKTLEKQEDKLKEKAKDIQKEVLSGMKDGN
jgi:prefoldin beta subunit